MADDPQEMGMAPGGEPRGHSSAQKGYESSNASLADPADDPRFAPLSAAELLAANSDDARYRSGYDDGFAAGVLLGARMSKVECLLDHGTELARIEAAARRFHELDAEDAHNKSIARSAAEHIDVRRARAGVGA